MAISVTHATPAPSGSTRLARSAWDQNHTLTGTSGRLLGFLSGSASEIALGTGLALDGNILSSSSQAGVASRVALAAVASPVAGDSRILLEAGRVGLFKFDSSNLSAMVTADPQQAVYVPPSSDTDGSSGAWVRQGFDRLEIEWFGAERVPHGTASGNYDDYDIKGALDAAQSFCWAIGKTIPGGWQRYGLFRLYIPAGSYYCSTWNMVTPLLIEGDSVGQFSSGALGTIIYFPPNVDGIIVNRHNTYGDTTVVSGTYGHADGSRFRNIEFRGWNTVVAGGSTSGNGVWCRARAQFDNCVFTGFGGHGAYVYAFAGAGGAAEGNANCTLFTDCAFNQNGGVGLYIQGADANVVRSRNCSYYGNRLGSLWDLSFLGGGSHEVETSSGGLGDFTGGTRKSGLRLHSGNIYACIYGREVQASTNAPSGTTADTANWLYVGATSGVYSGVSAWSSGETVETSADVLTAFSTTCVPILAYSEGGSAPFQIARGTIITAPALGVRVYGDGDVLSSQSASGLSTRAFVASQDGINQTIIGNRSDPTIALQMTYGDGANALMTVRAATVISSGFGAVNSGAFAHGGSFTVTLPTHSTHPLAFIPNRFCLPAWPNNNDWRRMGVISATADLNGVALNRGDVFYYASPSAGGKVGCVCTTSGTGGSGAVLKDFGSIDA